MRIISGILGGRKINPPGKMPARPTTDRAKEALFNILNNRLDWETVKALELFGGTGNISLEMASRGVPDVTVVEQDARLCLFMKQTCRQLNMEQIKIVRQDVFRFIQMPHEQKFDFIFADPPYALPSLPLLPQLLEQYQWMNPGGLFVLEHDNMHSFENTPHFERSKHYGTTFFSFFTY